MAVANEAACALCPSDGVFLRQWGDSAEAVLEQLAGDAAVALDSLRAAAGIGTLRVGFLGASQAGCPIDASVNRGFSPSTGVRGTTQAPVVSYPNARHSLQDADGGPHPPVWDVMMAWLGRYL